VKIAWPFEKPVDRAQFPDYFNVIFKPMDLEAVEKKMRRGRYDIAVVNQCTYSIAGINQWRRR
jgi:hypothetical protein